MARAVADFFLGNIGRLYTLAATDGAEGPRRREALREVGLVEGGAVAAHDGKIVSAGAEDVVRSEVRILPGAEILDADGGAVVPGWVDAHTHAIFARPRSEEFGRRLTGESYASIAAGGGGIRASVRDFRSRSEDELVEATRRNLRRALRYGSTTVEVKSGYGLDFEHEMKALRALRTALAEAEMPRVVATCLAAHEVPDEHREEPDSYLDEVCNRILPSVAEAGLAERADVFCEPGVFSPEQSRRVLEAAAAVGLRATVHADELEGSGGAELAVAMGADSADHLGRISEAGIEALADAPTVGVLLPGTIFSLGLEHQAPARRMIEAGVALALATDFNPGSNYCESMPLTLAIACTQLHLDPREVLTMGTINAAHALGLGSEVGSLEAGKSCDCLVLRESSVEGMCHHLGLDPVRAVVLRGRTVRTPRDPGLSHRASW